MPRVPSPGSPAGTRSLPRSLFPSLPLLPGPGRFAATPFTPDPGLTDPARPPLHSRSLPSGPRGAILCTFCRLLVLPRARPCWSFCEGWIYSSFLSMSFCGDKLTPAFFCLLLPPLCCNLLCSRRRLQPRPLPGVCRRCAAVPVTSVCFSLCHVSGTGD